VKTIDTLIADIHNLFGEKLEFNDDFFKQFGLNLEQIMSDRFNVERKGGFLRLSNIGKPDRQLWYEINDPEGGEKFSPQALIKFMYGDMQEQLLILLAKLAGHEVTQEQADVMVDGIPGHIDCLIDGCLVDVKSASRFAYPKFQYGTLLEPGNDAFGYLGQLAAYTHATTPGKPGYFFAVNKDLGHICLLEVSAEKLAEYRVQDRIAYDKQMVEGPIPPRCYTDVPDGKSGNMKLDTGCSYCSRKFECWDNLKTYYYSTGPRYLTRVVKEPKVNEFPDKVQV
jgi:hypothetical protein